MRWVVLFVLGVGWSLTGSPAFAGDDEARPQPASVRALVQQTRSRDADRQDAALAQLKAQHAKEAFPIQWFVDWALIDVPDGHSNPLLGWAYKVLRKRTDDARPHLGALLKRAPTLRPSQQRAIASLAYALKPIPAADVAHVVRIFEDPRAEYWLKRQLVDAVDGLGEKALPLAEPMIDYAADLLADRVVAAQEAEEAGISVSWDFVEYDIGLRLAAMGPGVVPILKKRLLALQGANPGRGPVPGSPASTLADALAGVGDAGVPVLIELMGHESPRLRRTVMWAIDDVKGPREDVRKALVARLKDSDPVVREQAATHLAAHGDASIPALLPLLQDPETRVRSAATNTLTQLKVSSADALEPLRDVLRGGSDETAYAAARGLASFGAEARVALPDLFDRLRRVHRYWRRSFVAVTADLAQHDFEALDAAWRDGSDEMRRGLIRVLATLDGAAQDADGAPVAPVAGKAKPKRKPLPDAMKGRIEEGLASKDLYVRLHAAKHLATKGNPRALPVLEEGFDSENGYLRLVATEGITELGQPAQKLLPRILKRVTRDDLYAPPGSMYRTEQSALGFAITSLGRYDLPRMFGLIDKDFFEISYHAGLAFEERGALGFAWLEDAWPRAKRSQKLAALDLVGSGRQKRGPGAAATRAAAISLARCGMRDSDDKIRLAAVEELPRTAEWTDELVPVLLELMDSRVQGVASSASYELGKFGKELAPFRPELEARLEHRNKNMRRAIRRMIEKLDDAEKK